MRLTAHYNTKNYDYLIVGAGLFGAIFAHEAAKRGKRSLIIDRRSHVGGNLYTHKAHGITVHDYGAHIFHTDNKLVWDYVNQFTEFKQYTHQVLANYKGNLYNLPFNMHTFYQMWGIKSPEEAQEKISKQRQAAAIKGSPKNLEEQAISLVGTEIYEKLIKGYTEKQWGRKATELPSFIIRRLPIRFTFDNNYFNHRYHGVPVEGYTVVFDKLLDHELIDIQLDTDFFTDKATYLSVFPRLVYTGMIDQFFDYKFGELAYRSVRFESEILPTDNAQVNAVINYTDVETPYTRSIEWRHFDQKGDADVSILTHEYPQEWDCSKEAYYPINDQKNSALFKKDRKEASKLDKVIIGGRLGNYQYYDMDQVIHAALVAVDKEFNR